MRPLRKRQIWRLVSLVAVCVISAATFSAFATGNGTSARATTVSFAFWGDPAEQRAYERVVSEFEASHPGIEIQIQYTPGQSDYLKKIATSFAGGEAPDLFLINYRTFGQYAATDALEPVDSYFAASSAIAAEDFYEISLDSFRYDGIAQTCMPQNISSLVVYYNEDLFKANSVPLPAANWTWNEFASAAMALTRDSDGDGIIDIYGIGTEQSLYRIAPFIWSKGGELVDDLIHPTTLTLDSPQALEALDWFASLGAATPSEAEAQAEDDEARFMRGGSAMFLQSRRAVPTLREIDGFTWNVAPMPMGMEKATVLHSDAFCMAASTTDKEAAWTFVEFAVGNVGQTVLAETGRIVPSLMRVAESGVFLHPTDGEVELAPANNQVFLDNIPYIHRLPIVSTWLEVEDIFNATFERIFYDELDIPAEVAEVTAETEPIFARAQK